MLTVEQMCNSKKAPSSVWMEYIQLKKRDNGEYVFCFFEGEDRKYYLNRVKKFYDENKINHFCCEGRRNVIDIFKKIIGEESYHNRLLFFIDRDYNLDSYEKNQYIYQTSEYSIENYYCKECVICGILETEAGMNKSSDDFEYAIKIFIELKEKFIQYYTCVNLWHKACKQSNLDIDIDRMIKFDDFDLNHQSTINFKREVTIDTVAILYKQILEDDVKKNKKYSNENLQKYTDKFDAIKDKIHAVEKDFDKNKDFRGKFLMIFLKKYIKLLHFMNKESLFSKKYTGFYLDPDSNNLISELSEFAETPECLIRYLLRI